MKSKNDANEGVEAFSINTLPTAQSPLPSTFKTCPLCGEEVKLVAIKCKHCGGSTKSKQEIASQQAAFAALFLVVIVIFGGFWAAKSYSEGLREEAEAMGRHSENLIRRMEGKPPIKY
ncbi:hypothetical protein N9B53_01220 [Mariniblastus sp.]|nr:hypothetical protein [Mariniblastus sp.]